MNKKFIKVASVTVISSLLLTSGASAATWKSIRPTCTKSLNRFISLSNYKTPKDFLSLIKSGNYILQENFKELLSEKFKDCIVTPPVTTPEPTPKVTPEPTTPVATPSPTPEVTPEPTTPVATPEVTPEPTPPVVTPDPTPVVTPEPTPPVNTPAPTPEVTPEPTTPVVTPAMTAMQQEMLDLVNTARVQNGVEPLTFNAELSRVALVKAQDMVDNNYFSHQSPTYGSPFKMMSNFGIKYRTAGENLAGNSTVIRAHTALMNSDGHRANILNSSFTELGLGITKSPMYGYVFVQMFIG